MNKLALCAPASCQNSQSNVIGGSVGAFTDLNS